MDTNTSAKGLKERDEPVMQLYSKDGVTVHQRSAVLVANQGVGMAAWMLLYFREFRKPPLCAFLRDISTSVMVLSDMDGRDSVICMTFQKPASSACHRC